MANYINVATGRYPVSESQIKAENPQVSFPKLFRPPEGYALVFPAPAPTHDPITQSVREKTTPKFINGHYEQDYEVLALPAETIAANVISKKASLKDQATNKRSQVEEGGTTVGGVPVKTDAGSQAKLTGALNFVGRNPNRTIKWKTAAGTFAPLNKAAIEAISDGVGEFVAKCFDAEAAHYAAIDLLTTPAQVAAYDVNTGWPV